MRSLMALTFALALAGTAAAADIEADSRIDAVTVYPSGAEVVRTARVKLEPGDHMLLFADLPAGAVPGSIRVEGKATAGLHIGSVDTRRVSVPSSDEEVAATERRRLEEAIQKLKDKRSALEGTIVAAETQKRLIDNLTKLPTTPAADGGAAVAQPDWGRLFELIGTRTAEAQKAILGTRIEIREVERKIKDLEGKLASLAPTQKRRTEVKVALTAETALEAEMIVRYQVRRAWWTPHYDARLTVGDNAQAPKLQLVRRAAIRQRTGETWDDVALALSTARPTAGTSAPELTPVTIDFEPEPQVSVLGGREPPRAAPAPVAQPRRLRAAEEAAADADAERQQARFAAKPKRAQVDVQTFQAVYRIGGRTTIPDTGETKQVEIDEMALSPTLVVRTVPRRTEKAYLYAKIVTARGAPLLPGRVALFRDAVFVGNGRLPLLAPGEEHELGFGIDDSVRVRHELAEEKRSESGIISTAKTDARRYRISVKNLHGRTIPVSVIDQIPVSQNADIAVELTGKSTPTRRDVDDKRGILAWDMELGPNEERVIEFGYRAKWPATKKVRYGRGE